MADNDHHTTNDQAMSSNDSKCPSSLFDDAVKVPSTAACGADGNVGTTADTNSVNDDIGRRRIMQDPLLSNNNLRRYLAELSSELLRLQESSTTQDGSSVVAKPRQTGLFSPEELRCWLVLQDERITNEPCTPSTPSHHHSYAHSPAPTTPHSAKTPLECLPSPTSTSDGRSEAANLLRARIQKMQEDNNSVGGGSSAGLFPASPNVATAADDENIGRIADFSFGVEQQQQQQQQSPSMEHFEQLRLKKSEAEAEAALLSAELVALRGRHEEEKRTLTRTTADLRRRNEELESRISLQRLEEGSSRDVAGGMGSARGGTSGAITSNGRSASSPNVAEDQDGGKVFGFRVRAFAQRFSSPPPNGGNVRDAQHAVQDEHREMRRLPSVGSCSSTINTNEDFGQIEFTPKEGQIGEAMDSSAHYAEAGTAGTNEEALKLIAALEEQLRQSEHRAKILEQRLQIVKESGDAVIRSLNEELADVAEDRARSESAMIKELSVLDSNRRAERAEYEKRMQEWIAHDADRKIEIEEYERRIESLLGTVRIMDSEHCADTLGDVVGEKSLSMSSPSRDKDAEKEMHKDLIDYIHLLEGKSQSNSNGRSSKRDSPLVSSINDAFDIEFNANPNVADDMIDYYRSRPELKDFTLKSELPRMDYEVLTIDEETGNDVKLVTAEQIRSYFASLEEGNMDEEVELLIRASNQSLLADPLAMLTGEGEGKLVHTGSFHSTVIATVCSFKLDLRHEGQRRVKVRCELAVCVPSGADNAVGFENSSENSDNDEKSEKKSVTLELARVDLAIQFSPSPTSTPSGPLVKYSLLDIKPTISNYDDGGKNENKIHSAAMVLARDRHTHIRYVENQSDDTKASPKSKNGFFSRVRQFSSNLKESNNVPVERHYF